MKRFLQWWKGQPVLGISLLAALVSMCFVPPDAGYLSYCNRAVLIQLFCLMLTVAGLRSIGVFEQVTHTQFPVGELSKHRVREIAEEHGFLNADKPDSQDICFVPDGDYARFIERYTGKVPETGDFLDPEGKRIGTHRGVIHYTIGQRKGLGISAPHPLYVCDICPADNTVTLGYSENLFSRKLTASDVNLISCDSLEEPVRVQAKIRYRHPAQPATAWMTPDGTLHVEFDEPQRAITCGQAVVLYDGDVVVGGGRITGAEKE